MRALKGSRSDSRRNLHGSLLDTAACSTPRSTGPRSCPRWSRVFVAAFSLADRPAPATARWRPTRSTAPRAFGRGTPPRNSLLELGARSRTAAPARAGDAALADRVAERARRGDAATASDVRRHRRRRRSTASATLETVVGVAPGPLEPPDRRGRPSRRAGAPGAAPSCRAPRRCSSSRACSAARDAAQDARARLDQRRRAAAPRARARWARAARRQPVDAVLVLGDLAGAHVRKPFVVPWSQPAAPAPLELRRTVEAALAREARLRPGRRRAPSAQWVAPRVPAHARPSRDRSARAGLPAVLLSARGERGPGADAPVSRARLRASAAPRCARRRARRRRRRRDAPPAFAASPTGSSRCARCCPTWAVRLLVVALLLPVLLAAIDGFARARRRREPVGVWLRWVLAAARCRSLLALAAGARLLGLTGVLDRAGRRRSPPDAVPSSAPATRRARSRGRRRRLGLARRCARCCVAPARRRAASPAAGGAGGGDRLVLRRRARVWVVEPVRRGAAAARALHLWLLAVAPEPRLRGPRARAVVAGLLPPLLVVRTTRARSGSTRSSWPWMALLLVAGGARRRARPRSSCGCARLRRRALIACCARAAGEPPGPADADPHARAGRPTPAPARSAAPSPPCGDDRDRPARSCA